MERRTGLRIIAHKVDDEVARAFKLFAKWLRRRYGFPGRVPVYLSEKDKVLDRNREPCISIFFAPFDSDVEPYIRIATGDYSSLIPDEEQDDELFSLLYSLALGVVRYQAWVEDNAGFDSYDTADDDAEKLLREYVAEVGMPIY